MNNKENLIITKVNIQGITEGLIYTIESLKIEERCSNYNMTWKDTKNLFLKESVAGRINNPVFWESVENFSKIIKEYTKWLLIAIEKIKKAPKGWGKLED